MVKFILKGLLRDRSRSLFPLIMVIAGVSVSVLLFTFANGFTQGLVDTSSRFETGHVKIVTQAYHELIDHKPNDLALMGIDELMEEVRAQYPEIKWAERIYFGGLLDVPDEDGETRDQIFFSGMAVDILSPGSLEFELLDPETALVRGRMPSVNQEIIISENMARSLSIELGDEITLISDTMDGNMTFGNFRVVGTISFGITALDRSALIADISGVRELLDMQDAVGEILGFLPRFDPVQVDQLAADFNERFSDPDDEFSPLMLSMLDQNNMRDMYTFADTSSGIIITIFIFIMSIVLWNSGLMNGIRRYGEIGVRLAIGEGKFHLYRVMVYEFALIGFAGTIIGTFIGLLFSYYMQNVGIDLSGALPQMQLMMSNVIRTNVTTGAYYIGFIPGLLATTLGAALAGSGIIKRNTAQLFKELET